MKTQYDNLKIRCSEHEHRIQQLITLLNEKQICEEHLINEIKQYEPVNSDDGLG